MPKVLYATGQSVPAGIVAKTISNISCTNTTYNNTIRCNTTANFSVGDSIIFRDFSSTLTFGNTSSSTNSIQTANYIAENQQINFYDFTVTSVTISGVRGYPSNRVIANSTLGLSRGDSVVFSRSFGGGQPLDGRPSRYVTGIVGGVTYYIDFIPDNSFGVAERSNLGGPVNLIVGTSSTFPTVTTYIKSNLYGTLQKGVTYYRRASAGNGYTLSLAPGGATVGLYNIGGTALATTIPFNFGNIIAGTKYYIKEIVNANSFKISETRFGNVFPLYDMSGSFTADLKAEFTTDPGVANSQGLLSIFEAEGATPELKYAPINNPYGYINRIYFDTRFDYLNIVNTFAASIDFPYQGVTQECGKKNKDCSLVPRTGTTLYLLGYHGQSFIPAIIGYDLNTKKAFCGDQIVQVNGDSTFRLFQLLVDGNAVWIKELWYVRGQPLQANSFNFKVFIFNKPASY